MIALRVMDDRDRPAVIPLARVGELPRWWRARLGPWSLRRAPRIAWRIVRTPAVVLAVAAACILSVLARLLLEDMAMFLGLIVFGPVMVPLLTLALFAGRGMLGLGRGLGPTLRDAMLAWDCCPSCGYDLSASMPERDLCRVCPECGAAWILPRDKPESVVVTVAANDSRPGTAVRGAAAQEQGPGTEPGP
ncbi:MAG: hypothetical protein KF699_08610 [Phycisphaeraceae bacterium]|nr:hypothetical protein [Phycisphaeraceae bacterium]MBX3406135.1 hypothetical protein [Phycisphaeraceae bacterium]